MYNECDIKSKLSLRPLMYSVRYMYQLYNVIINYGIYIAHFHTGYAQCALQHFAGDWKSINSPVYWWETGSCCVTLGLLFCVCLDLLADGWDLCYVTETCFAVHGMD